MDREPFNDVRTKFDLMPDAGIPALQVAYDRIREKRATQTQILADTNEQLAAVGLPALSLSNLNRWALRIRRKAVRRPTMSQAFEQQPNTNVAAEVARQLRALADDIERQAVAPAK
ncbi:hypothetical protein X747_14770 [Mesorhizobium sp. LNJC384A00]|uniref:hypothetical protein n=1 Tax=Mesorhizobium sp. LNJC384A00 TaxID=1287268 RepID=UPI0003CE9100|nr:hypothetical protein [Mesorhizobium sp. LNJC384A00]ESY42040.1 hypothetical protein X747_14770 [Mesorhizobium sp. LNJC384A00]